MNLAGEEEKETCTGKRLRSHDSTTAWGSSSSDAADAAGETERTLTKNARRRPAGAQARNAETEPAQKKRLREGKLKEDEQEKSVKQRLERNPDAANPQHDPQLPGAPPPGATAQEEKAQSNLTRGAGYDTTNNMNLFLTQCCGCSNPVRNKKTLFDLLIQQITSLEQHGILDRLEGQPLRPWRARPERLATFSQRITNAELEVRGGKNPALWRVGCVADRLAPRRSAASPAPGHATSAAKKLTL